MAQSGERAGSDSSRPRSKRFIKSTQRLLLARMMDATLINKGVTVRHEKKYDLVERDICVPGATVLRDGNLWDSLPWSTQYEQLPDDLLEWHGALHPQSAPGAREHHR